MYIYMYSKYVHKSEVTLYLVQLRKINLYYINLFYIAVSVPARTDLVSCPAGRVRRQPPVPSPPEPENVEQIAQPP